MRYPDWSDIAGALSGMIQMCGDIAFNPDGSLSEIGAECFAEMMTIAARDAEMRRAGIDPNRQWLESICREMENPN